MCIEARYVSLLITCLLIAPSLAFPNSYTSVEYNLSLANIDKSILKVEATIKGKLSEKLIVNLPSKWAGGNYVEQIKNVEVLSNGNHYDFFLVKEENHQAIIKIPGSINSLTISYEIHQKQDNPSTVHEATIQDNLVHSPGYGIFSTPADLPEVDEVHFRINWLNKDPKWRALSSYGTKDCLAFEATVPQLLHAIYIAGKTRVHQIIDNPTPVVLSLYGEFSIPDEKIISDLKKIIASQRLFFNDFNFPYYTISLVEGNDPHSMSGTGLHDTFAAFLPKNTNTNTNQIDYYILFAHEHLHNWIGGKISNDGDRGLNYWFTEGFTEYYSRVIALRSGGLSIRDFIQETNQLLQNYYLSPVVCEANTRIEKDFWKDRDVEKLPYYRGFVFSIYLNNKIRERGDKYSLDNIMQDLFKSALNQKFSRELFQNIAKNYVNEIDNDILEFIEQGNIIHLEGVALPLVKVSMGVYQLGFDKQKAMETGMIKDIDPQSNAYKSGLRNDQKILGYDVPKGQNPDQIITIETTEGTFKFRPEHIKKKEVYQIKEQLSPMEKQQVQKFFGDHNLQSNNAM